MIEFNVYNSDYENEQKCLYKKIYTNLSIIQAKRIASIKLQTDKVCQIFTYKIDNNKKLIFSRINKIYPNGEIIYGEWN